MSQNLEDIQTFAKRIREKTGAYSGVLDDELVKRVVEKHPEYRERVALPATPTTDYTTGEAIRTITPHGKWGAPRDGGKRPHRGIDLRASEGTPYGVAAPARVTYAGPKGGYGNLIEVEYDLNGRKARQRFGHNKEIKVKVGDTVSPGQVIALAGQTGNAKGSHIHNEWRENGQSVDPSTVKDVLYPVLLKPTQRTVAPPASPPMVAPVVRKILPPPVVPAPPVETVVPEGYENLPPEMRADLSLTRPRRVSASTTEPTTQPRKVLPRRTPRATVSISEVDEPNVLTDTRAPIASPSPNNKFMGGDYRVRVEPNDTQESVRAKLLDQAARQAGLPDEQRADFVSKSLAKSKELGGLVSDEEFERYKKQGYIPIEFSERVSPSLVKDLRAYQAGSRGMEARPNPSLYERAKETVLENAPGLANINTQEGVRTVVAEEGLARAINAATLGATNFKVDPRRFRNEREATEAQMVGAGAEFVAALIPYMGAAKAVQLGLTIPRVARAVQAAEKAGALARLGVRAGTAAATFGGVGGAREAIKGVRGESEGVASALSNVAREAAVGATFGAVSPLTIPLRAPAVAGGTYTLDKLFGEPDSEAAQSAAFNALFSALGGRGQVGLRDLLGKAVRFRRGNQTSTVRVEPNGVRELRGEVADPDVINLRYNERSKAWEAEASARTSESAPTARRLLPPAPEAPRASGEPPAPVQPPSRPVPPPTRPSAPVVETQGRAAVQAARRLNISLDEYRNGVSNNLSAFDSLKPNERVMVNGVQGYVIDRPTPDSIRVNIEGEPLYGIGGEGERVITREQASDPFERGVQLTKAYEPSIDVEARDITPPSKSQQVIKHSDPRIDGGRVIGKTSDGKLKVENNEGGISVVKNPRTAGNREATIVKERRDATSSDTVKLSEGVETLQASGSTVLGGAAQNKEATRPPSLRSSVRGAVPAGEPIPVRAVGEEGRQGQAALTQKGLTRNFRAGTNDASMTFASSVQRDLYDYAASNSLSRRGGQNPKAKAATYEQIKQRLVDAGIPESELLQRAMAVRNDVKAQMKGVKHLEERKLSDNVLTPKAESSSRDVEREALQVAWERGRIRSYEDAAQHPKGGAVAMDALNLQAEAARALANKFALNPRAVYDWANRQRVDLVSEGHRLSKPDSGLWEAVLSNKPVSAALSAEPIYRRMKESETPLSDYQRDVATERGRVIRKAPEELTKGDVVATTRRVMDARTLGPRTLTKDQAVRRKALEIQLRQREITREEFDRKIKTGGLTSPLSAPIPPPQEISLKQRALETQLRNKIITREEFDRKVKDLTRPFSVRRGERGAASVEMLVSPFLRRSGFREATPEDRKALKIPPAWMDVQVAVDAGARLVATGRDAKGRTQRLYSAEHTEQALVQKFLRQREFNTALPDLIDRIERDLNGRQREEASVLRLIALTGFRVGGSAETLAKVKAYGASTLRPEHVKIEGDTVHFDFTGKLGVRQEHSVTDALLARDLERRITSGRDVLFNTNDTRVRNYLHSISGRKAFKVHDFRTWNATEVARRAIENIEPPTTAEEYWTRRDEVGDIAARKIGDTRLIALETYVDPLVFEDWRIGAGVEENAQRPRQARRKAGDVQTAPGADEQSLRDQPLRQSSEATPTPTREIRPPQVTTHERRTAERDRSGEAGFINFSQVILNVPELKQAIRNPLEVVTALRRAGLLSSVKMHMRNLTSNTAFAVSEEMARPFASLADIAMSYKTGVRTKAGIQPLSIARAVVGKHGAVYQGSKDFWKALWHGDAKAAEKAQIQEMRTGIPLLDVYIKGVGNLVAAMDKPAKAYALKRELDSLAYAQAKTEQSIDKSVNVRARAKELRDDPPEWMKREAIAYSEIATFQNDNPVSTGIQWLKGQVEHVPHPAAKHALRGLKYGFETIVPFDRTPTNVFIRILEHTPAGIPISAYKYRQIGRSAERVAYTTKETKQAEKFDRRLERVRGREDKRLADRREQDVGRLIDNFNKMVEGLERKHGEKGMSLFEYQMIDRARRGLDSMIAAINRTAVQEDAQIKKAREFADRQTRETRGQAEKLANELFTKEEQRRFVETVGRTGMGNILGALAILLLSKGLIDLAGVTKKEEEEKKFWAKRERGVRDGSLLIPNAGRVTIIGNPLGNSLTFFATAYEQSMRKGTNYEKTKAATKAGVSVAVQQPILRTYLEDRPDYRKGEEVVANYAASFAPRVISEAAEVIDEKPRRFFGKGAAAQFQKVLPPGLLPPRWEMDRSALEVQDKPFGGSQERGDVYRRMFRVVDPLDFTTQRGSTPQSTRPLNPPKREKKEKEEESPRGRSIRGERTERPRRSR